MRLLALTKESDRSETALLVGLKQHGVDIEVLGEPNAASMAGLKNAAIPVTSLAPRSRIDPVAVLALRRRLKTGVYDIFHAFTGRMLSNALIAASGLPVRRVAYRGTAGHVSRLDPSAWLSWLNPGIDRISCVSEAVHQYLLTRGVPERKLVTIYKGHDLQWYDSINQLPLDEFGIPGKSFVIGCVANMRPIKGVHVLIEACSHFTPGFRPHVLAIGEVRDGNIPALAERTSAHADFHFPGFRANAISFMRGMSVFVMPSCDREGFPKALIEAMALGVPVVVTNVGGLLEIVRHEEDGLVVPSNDPLALAQALTRLIADPPLRERLGAAARQRVASAFTISETVQKTLAMYASLG